MTLSMRERSGQSTLGRAACFAAAALGGFIGSACPSFAQGTPPGEKPTSTPQAVPAVRGEVVTELDKQMWTVFQAKDGAHWFGSRGRGAYRYDGKQIVRFKTEHGLAGNEISGFQEDRAGNLYISTNGGISRFDGRTFSTLPNADPNVKSEWKLEPDDLWFGGPKNSGAACRYDGKVMHFLPFPTTKAGDQHYIEVPRDKYPNAKYSPYDVFTIFKDSKGHIWFGTAILGVCRYDGRSFSWGPGAELGSAGTRSIIEDKDGKFWFASTANRYTVFPSEAPGTGELKVRKEPGIGPKDPVEAFMSAVKDENGHLWLSTLGDGVYRYDGKETTHYPVTDENGKPIWVFSIYRDAQAGLWLGTHEHGVYKFNGRSFERFNP